MTSWQTLPESIMVDGTEIPINADFRASAAFEELMQDPTCTDEQRVAEMLELYFTSQTMPMLQTLVLEGKAQALFEAILWFYRCGKAPREDHVASKNEPCPYSFAADEQRIYASFREQYALDLYDVPFLHWWKFSSMFAALGENTEMARVMHIRTAKFENGMSAKDRAALRRAKEFSTFEEGVNAWQRYYGKHEDVLPDRMFFIVDPNGKKVATATAFFDEKLPGGWLHWVSVSRDAQGKGLSRPLIAHTLHRLQALGYKELFVPTQTTTWVAAKLYLDFGFRPVPENLEEDHFGWRMLKTLTDHPALKELEPVEVDELLNK